MTDHQPDLKFLLDEILSGDEGRRQRARMMLLAMDEDAVQALVTTFHAGVSEAQGVVLLDVLTEIGGPVALQLLADVYANPPKPAWQRWAALGLARNAHEDDALLMTFLDWLQGDDLPQRQTAALALGYIGGDAMHVPLIHALYDPEIAPQAVRALSRRGDVVALAKGYNTNDAATWEMVTEALLDLGDDGVLPLIEIVQQEHPDYYEQVIISLQNLNRPEAKEVLAAADYDADGSRKPDTPDA